MKSSERMEVQLTLQISWKEHATFYGSSISVVLQESLGGVWLFGGLGVLEDDYLYSKSTFL